MERHGPYINVKHHIATFKAGPTLDAKHLGKLLAETPGARIEVLPPDSLGLYSLVVYTEARNKV
jgi:hypothetical protein